MYLIQRTRRTRRPTLASLYLLAYLIAVAVVPPGYMAAPLASGTPFHLCPGDTRSALIITALADVAPIADPHDHHHTTHQHGDGAAGGISASSPVAEPDCQFAGISAVSSGVAYAVAEGPEPLPLLQSAPRGPATRDPAWLRPPVRSPPA